MKADDVVKKILGKRKHNPEDESEERMLDTMEKGIYECEMNYGDRE